MAGASACYMAAVSQRKSARLARGPGERIGTRPGASGNFNPDKSRDTVNFCIR